MAAKSAAQKTREAQAALRDALALAQKAEGQAAVMGERIETLDREVARISERYREAIATLKERDNALRTELHRMTVENARLRGYLDHIEDTTPVLPEPRYGRQNEQRSRTRAYGDQFGEAAAGTKHHWYLQP